MASIRKLGGERRRRLRTKLASLQGGRCCYCAIEFNDNPSSDRYGTIEHIQDRAAGGANAQTNLAMACFRCNHRAAREHWSPDFKLHKIQSTNVIALSDLIVEHMELPPLYLQRVGRAA